MLSLYEIPRDNKECKFGLALNKGTGVLIKRLADVAGIPEKTRKAHECQLKNSNSTCKDS